MRIHHAYVGIFLIVWSLLTGVIGEYSPPIAYTGLGVGLVLLVHDVYWHITHKKH